MTKFSFSLEPNRVQFSPIGRTKRNRTDRYSIVILIATNHPLQDFQRRYFPRLQSGPLPLPTGRKRRRRIPLQILYPIGSVLSKWKNQETKRTGTSVSSLLLLTIMCRKSRCKTTTPRLQPENTLPRSLDESNRVTSGRTNPVNVDLFYLRAWRRRGYQEQVHGSECKMAKQLGVQKNDWTTGLQKPATRIRRKPVFK